MSGDNKYEQEYIGDFIKFFGINLGSLTPGEIEKLVDIGLRHRAPAARPIDYLRQWLTVGRAFARAAPDDSWGEFEKLFAIVIKRLVVAERRVEELEACSRQQSKIAGEAIRKLDAIIARGL